MAIYDPFAPLAEEEEVALQASPFDPFAENAEEEEEEVVARKPYDPFAATAEEEEVVEAPAPSTGYDPFAAAAEEGDEEVRAPVVSMADIKPARQIEAPRKLVTTPWGMSFTPADTGQRNKFFEHFKMFASEGEALAQELPRGIWGQAGAAVTGIGRSRMTSETESAVRGRAEEIRQIDIHFRQLEEGKQGLNKYLHYDTPEKMQALKDRRDEHAAWIDEQYAVTPEEMDSPEKIRETVERVRKYEEKNIDEKLKDTGFGQLGEFMQDQSSWWRELQQERKENWDIDPVVANSGVGQFIGAAGRAPGYVGLTFLGPLGFGLMQSTMYSNVEEDAIRAAEKRGEVFDPSRHIGELTASATGQALLERAFGFERIADSVLKGIGRHQKMSFKDFVKKVFVQSQVSGIEEAATEPTQGAWNDFIASISYDDGREILTGDALKQRFMEAVSGWGLGIMMGGSVVGAGSYQDIEVGYEAPMGYVNLGGEQGPDLEFAGFMRDSDGNPMRDPNEEFIPLLKMKSDFPEMGVTQEGEIFALHELANSGFQFAIPQIPEVDTETEAELTEAEKKYSNRVNELMELVASNTELTDAIDQRDIEESVETFVDPETPLSPVEQTTPLNQRTEFQALEQEETPELDFVAPTEQEAADAIDRMIADSLNTLQQEYKDFVLAKDPDADPVTWEFSEMELRMLENEVRRRAQAESQGKEAAPVTTEVPYVDITQEQATEAIDRLVAEESAEIQTAYTEAAMKADPEGDPVTWQLSESDINMLESELRERLQREAQEKSEAWKKMTPSQRRIVRLQEQVEKERVRYDDRLAAAKERFEARLAKNDAKFENRLNKTVARYQSRIDKLTQDSKDRLARSREKMKEAIAKKDEEIAAIKLNYQQRLETQKAKDAEKLANEFKRRTNLALKNAQERANVESFIADLEALVNELPASVQKQFKGYATMVKKKKAETLQRYFNNRVERMNQLMDNYVFMKNRDTLSKLIKRVRKKKKKPKEYEIFDRMKQYAEMPLEEALNRAEAIRNPKDDNGNPIDRAIPPEQREEVFLLDMFGGKLNSDNREDFDGKDMRLARQEAEYILREKKSSVKERIARRQAHEENLRTKVKDILLEGKELLGDKFLDDQEKVKTIGGLVRKVARDVDTYGNKYLDSLEMLLDSLDSTEGRFSGFLHDTFASRVFEARQRENRRNSIAINKFGAIMERVLQLNGVTGGKKALLDMAESWEETSTGHGITYNHQGTKDKPVPLSRWQAITMWMQWQDESLAPTFEKMGITEDTMKKVEEYIQEDGKMVGTYLLNEYKKYGEELRQTVADNDNYIIEILKNYSPISRYVEGKAEDETTLEMLNMKDYGGESVKNRHMIHRTKNTNELNFKGANDVFKQHAYQMNHYFEFAEVAADLRAVFKNSEVRRAIRQRTGDNKMNMLLDDIIGDTLNNGMRRAQMDDIMAKFVRGTTVGSLALRVPVFFKQLGSAPAYINDMPTTEWLRYEKDFWKNPIQNSQKLIGLDYIQNRISNSYDRELKQIARQGTNKGIANIRTVRDKWMFMTRYGDLGAILVGGWPLYQYTYDQAYAREKGKKKSDEEADQIASREAERRFSETTARQQQDSDLHSLGYWQRGDGIQKLFTQYKTTPIQYHRNVVNAIRAAKKGRISKADAAKTVFIFHVLMPQIYTAIGSAFIGMWGDDDDAVEEFWRRQGNALLVGNANALFIVGDFIKAIVDTMGDKDQAWMIDTNIPALDVFEQGGKGLAKAFNAGDGDERWEGTDMVLENIFKAAGVPYGQVMDFFRAAGEVAEGETEYPLLRLMGWSDYQIPGDEEE